MAFFCVQDIPSVADASVTTLALFSSNDLLVAGYGDGSVRLFDKRVPPSSRCLLTIYNINVLTFLYMYMYLHYIAV